MTGQVHREGGRTRVRQRLGVFSETCELSGRIKTWNECVRGDELTGKERRVGSRKVQMWLSVFHFTLEEILPKGLWSREGSRVFRT